MYDSTNNASPDRGRPSPAKLLAPLAASLTLGLAPFSPEPHVVGKIRWVAGGAVGMAPMDWFDLAMHGAPWVWLIVAVGLFVRDTTRKPQNV